MYGVREKIMADSGNNNTPRAKQTGMREHGSRQKGTGENL